MRNFEVTRVRFNFDRDSLADLQLLKATCLSNSNSPLECVAAWPEPPGELRVFGNSSQSYQDELLESPYKFPSEDLANHQSWQGKHRLGRLALVHESVP